jgi:hypothetical protein
MVPRWNDAALKGVRDAKMGAPMAARALAIVDTCMYDAWAAYDERAVGTQLAGALRRPAVDRTLASFLGPRLCQKREDLQMKWQLAAVILLPSILILIVLIYLRIANRPASRQRSDEVVIREPGKRFLGPPQPVAPEARKDLEFAWLSQSAYEEMQVDGKSREVSGVTDPDSALCSAGWARWPDFPDNGLQQEIETSHLRVQVWTNRARGAIAVAFGGTVLESGKDWRSNLRWFTPLHKDEYTEIVDKFGPAFVGKFLECKQNSEWAFLEHAAIYATGHSLGGGLAQNGLMFFLIV